MKKIAVITGASSGMGRDFVKMIDKIEECDEIWVIARRLDKLSELARGHKRSLVVIGQDIPGDPLLPLGELLHIVAYIM